jgi:hypothetical protein
VVAGHVTGVKANWFTDPGLDLTDVDPFADSAVDVVALGSTVDLGSPDSINLRLVELLQREGQLWNEGVRCPVKVTNEGAARPDATCAACPIRHHSPDDPMTALCDVGVEQERMMTMSVIHRERPDAVDLAR